MSKLLLYKSIVQFLDKEVVNEGYSDDMRESLAGKLYYKNALSPSLCCKTQGRK